MVKLLIYKLKKNRCEFFVLKTVIFLIVIFFLDYILGNILCCFYFKQESGFQYRTTYSIEKTKADVLIFGSSRANHHYYPAIFEKRLNLTYYNVGRDGNSMFYHYAVLEGVLKRYSPKIVILDFTLEEFKQNKDSYSRISSLLPYYKRHPEMRSIIEMKSSHEKIFLLSAIYPFNSSVLSILIGNMDINKKRRGDIQGYIPLTNKWDKLIQIYNCPLKYDIDSTMVNLYRSFIHDCINSKVKLYIVCSPSFALYNRKDYSILLGQEIAKKNGVQFFDYSNDPFFIKHANLFSDTRHLNDDGAKCFTKFLINKIIKTNNTGLKNK